MNDNELIVVRNRNIGSTTYVLTDDNTHRTFAPGEAKKVPLSELKALQFVPGGTYLLDNLLIVESEEALEELNMKVEPEYFFTEKQIRELLLGVNNMDAFLDFLDFATEGAIEIAKDIAVKEQIPDTRKRKALSEKTGFNIDNAIKVNEIMNEGEPEEEAPVKKERRVVVKKEAEAATTSRRVTAPKANIDTTGATEDTPAPAVPKYVVKK